MKAPSSRVTALTSPWAKPAIGIEPGNLSSVVLSSGEPTTYTTPGRAYMRGVGRIQAYRVDSTRLIERAVGKPEAPGMTIEERQVAQAALQNGDCLNLPLLKKLGYSESAGEQVLREWDNRGWTAKDRARGNKRCLTESAKTRLALPDQPTL